MVETVPMTRCFCCPGQQEPCLACGGEGEVPTAVHEAWCRGESGAKEWKSISLESALKQCITALEQAPEIGERYDANHQRQQMEAIVNAKMALGVL